MGYVGSYLTILSMNHRHLVSWIHSFLPKCVNIDVLFGLQGNYSVNLVDVRLRHVLSVWLLGDDFIRAMPPRPGVFSIFLKNQPLSVSVDQIWLYASLFHDIGMWNQEKGADFLANQQSFAGFAFAPPSKVSNVVFSCADFFAYYRYIATFPYSEKYEHGILGALLLLNNPTLLFQASVRAIDQLTLGIIGQTIAVHNIWPTLSGVTPSQKYFSSSLCQKTLQKKSRSTGLLSFALCLFDTLDVYKRLYDSRRGIRLISRRLFYSFAYHFRSSFTFVTGQQFTQIEIDLTEAKKAFLLIKHRGYSLFLRWKNDVLALPTWMAISVRTMGEIILIS